MHIKKIQLKNVKSYFDQTVEFSEGINFISGANGAGKTTLIESIGYILFDCKPYHPIRMFIRNGRATAKIDVWFEANDEREYKVTRKFGRGSSQWTVYDVETDNEICDSPADVRDWLSDFIEIEPGISLDELFKNVIGVRQGSFTSPFLLSPNERKKLFDTILKVDNYKNAFGKTRDTESIFRNEIDKLELLIDEKQKQIERYDEIKDMFEEISEEIEQTNTKISYINSKLEVDFQEWKKLQSLKNHLQKCIDEINKTNTRLGILKTKLEQAESDIKESQEAVKVLDRTEDGYKTYVKLEKKIRELEIKRKNRDQLRSKVNKLEQNIAVQQTVIQSKESDYQKRRSELQNEQTENQAKLEDLAERIESQNHEVRKFKKKLASFRDVFKNLDNLSDSLNELKYKRSQIEIKFDQYNRLSGEIQRLEKSLLNYDKQKAIADKLSAMESKLEYKKREVEQISIQIKIAKSNKEKAKGGVCPLLGERCQNIGDVDLEEYFAQSVEELSKRVRIPQEKVQQLKRELRCIQSAREELIRLNQNKEKLETLSKELKSLEKSILDTVASLELEKIQEQIQSVEKVRRKPDEQNNFDSHITHQVSHLIHQSKYSSGSLNSDTILNNLFKVENRLESYIKSIHKSFEREHQRISDKFSIVQLKLQRTKAQQDSLKGEKKKCELELRELEKARQDLVYEKKELYTKIARLNRYEEKISLLGDLDSGLENSRNQLKKHKSAYQSYVRNEDNAEKLVVRQHSYIKIKKQIELTQKKLQELQSDREQIESQFTKTEKQRENKEDTLYIEEDNQTGDDFRLFEELASLQNLISEKKQEKVRQKTNLESLVKEKTKLGDELSRMDAIKSEIRGLKSKLDRYEKGYHIIRFIRFQLLNRAGEELAERYVRSISAEASRIYREVSKENVMLEWGKDYEIIFNSKEGKRTRKRTFKQLSGGEQMTAALAVRMALMNSLSKVRLGIFDEPTINMDTERKDNFAHAISALTNNFNQLFIISHDDTFDAITERIIVVEKTEEDGSIIKDSR